MGIKRKGNPREKDPLPEAWDVYGIYVSLKKKLPIIR